MTFTEIQTEIADRLNLTSTAALARIGRSINERYKWLASSIGINTTARQVVTASSVIGNRNITFGPTPTGVEKLFSVYDATVSPNRVLTEKSFDELRNQSVEGDPPSNYAIQSMGSSSVTILLSSIPATLYVLSADAEVNLATLSGAQVPAFAEDFHHILVYGGMATELEKQEKYDFAEKQEEKYEQRLSDLRMFIAKSAYKDITQGKLAQDFSTRPWWQR